MGEKLRKGFGLLKEKGKKSDIAIIGMACIFPGAPDLATFWHNITHEIDCISDIPPNWSSAASTDAENMEIYCRKGGFLQEKERQFNPMEFGIIPSGLEGAEPDQFFAVKVASDALADAGYLKNNPYRKHTAIILGRGSYVNAGLMNLVQHGWVVDQTIDILRKILPDFSDMDWKAIKKGLIQSLPALKGETVPGLVPNIAAGRIANRLDLMGPSYLVDAACSSSLVAVEDGVRMLRSDECDLALVGGMQGGNTALSYRMFCLINAMSQSGCIRPFDEHADGTILGEGLGMAVLKRREDAERDNDRIYAFIKAVGSASDGRALGLLAPRPEGAALCLRRAYDRAGLPPTSIGLIEAHGTGTHVGDVAELEALKQVFGGREKPFPSIAIGSVKSMIGHSLGAAGIAGLIKTALAIYHKVLPPTLNCRHANPEARLDESPFYINTKVRPWIHGYSAPRRAGVNAFGFGGINAHVILEENHASLAENLQSSRHIWDSEVFILQADSRSDLVARLRTLQQMVQRQSTMNLKDLAYTLCCPMRRKLYTLSIVASSTQDLARKLSRAHDHLEDERCRKIKDRKGIYFFEKRLLPAGKLAFLFPGEGSQYTNMLADLCIHFPEVRRRFDRMDRLFIDHLRGFVPSDFIYPPPLLSAQEKQDVNDRIWQMDGAIEAVLTANDALYHLMQLLDIIPDVVVGHSTGEYSAMRIAGMFDILDEAGDGSRVERLNREHAALVESGKVPKACLLSIGASPEEVESLIREVGLDVHIGMKNCLHQTVVVGAESEMKGFIDVLQQSGRIFQYLPFDRPYHTPLFESYAGGIRHLLTTAEMSSPRLPVYSCTICAPYPKDPSEIAKLAVEHWIRPVDFLHTIEKMYDDGVRVFLEIGPRGMLTSFVNDCLKNRNYLSIASNLEIRPAIEQLNHMVGMLAAQGLKMNLNPLFQRRQPSQILLENTGLPNANVITSNPHMTLPLVLPKMDIDTDYILTRKKIQTIPRQAASDFSESDSPVVHHGESSAPPVLDGVGIRERSTSGNGGNADAAMEAYLRTMERFLSIQRDVMKAYLEYPEQSLSSNRRIDQTDSMSTASEAGSRASIPHEGVESLQRGDHPPAQQNAYVHKADESTDAVLSGLHPEAQPLCTDKETLVEKLLEIVSEKTGYPLDALDASLDLEADLGIDSIKRVEILSSLEEIFPNLTIEDSQKVVTLKTLDEIVAHLVVSPDSADSVREDQNGRSTPSAEGAIPQASLPPLIHTIVHSKSEEEVVFESRIDLLEHEYLHHHSLIPWSSGRNGRQGELPVMPLTMSMEILAEAGAVLMRGKVMVGMKNIRGHRWIVIEKEALDIQLVARRSPLSPSAVDVQLFNLSDLDAKGSDPAVEATILFSDAYPPMPTPEKFTLSLTRLSKWQPEALYEKGMFHGPFWQGVKSMDEWAENGCTATFEVLPHAAFLNSVSNPELITDPIILDAAGQVVGFWAQEGLPRDVIVFPYGAEALHIYRPTPPTGQKVTCQAHIRKTGDRHLSSDIRMIDENGQLWMVLEGWADKRFHLPPDVHGLWLSPLQKKASKVLSELTEMSPGGNVVGCIRDEALYDRDEIFWNRVFTKLLLTPDEQARAVQLDLSPRQLAWWLCERMVAKDAVRELIRRKRGKVLGPGDIEISEPVSDRMGISRARVAAEGFPVFVGTARGEGIVAAVAGSSATEPCMGIEKLLSNHAKTIPRNDYIIADTGLDGET